MNYYTYAHTRNDTGQIFYIGKGTRHRAYRASGRSQRWNRIAAKHGHEVQILATWPDEESAYEHEKFLIQCFRDLGYDLCNFTNGGDGWNGGHHSDETKQKISAYQKTKKITELQIEKWKCRRHTAETKAKISAANKGRFLSAEAKEKISIANKGKQLSAEIKAKLSIAQKQRWLQISKLERSNNR